MNDIGFKITPVKNYKVPKIPTLGDNNSDLLKKMPKRWRKNAKVLAGLGLIGMFALSGCSIGNNTGNRQSTSEGQIIEWRQDIPWP